MLRSWFLLPGAVELERAHVPRRAGHQGGAVARSAAGDVPVARLGEVAAPGQQHGRPGRSEADDEVGRAVAVQPSRVWPGPLIEVIVPPQMVSRRGAPEYISAPLDRQAVGSNESDGNVHDSMASAGSGTSTRSPPPPGPQILPVALVTFQVARKS